MTAYRKEGTHEQSYATANGIAMLLLLIAMIAALAVGLLALRNAFVWPAIALAVAIAFVSGGFFMLQPNEAGVLTLDTRDPGNCLVRFKSNRAVGWLLFLGLAAEMALAALLP